MTPVYEKPLETLFLPTCLPKDDYAVKTVTVESSENIVGSSKSVILGSAVSSEF